MKKQILRCLAAMLTLVPLCTAAAGQSSPADCEGRAFVCSLDPDFYSEEAILALYPQPDASLDPVAHLFTGTPLDILEDDGGPFVHVRCGDLEGYALRLYLSFGVRRASVYTDSALGVITCALPETSAPLYDAPDGEIIAALALHTDVTIQAITAQWAYVAAGERFGYVPLHAVHRINDDSFLTLAPESPSTTIRLYAAPSDSAPILGEYIGYQTANILFSPESVQNAFQHVSIGRMTGYVHTNDISTGSGIIAPFVPPVVLTHAETVLYSDTALSTPLESIPADTRVKVLGELSTQDAYHIQWGPIDAFVRKSALSGVPVQAPLNPRLSLFQTSCETPFFLDSSRNPGRTLSKYTSLYLLEGGYTLGSQYACAVYLPDTHEIGFVAESDLSLIHAGEEASETSPDPDLFGDRTLYATSGSVLRAEPADSAAACLTHTDYDDAYYLLGGVLPNGYVRVRSVEDETREGYILAAFLDYAHW